MYSFQSIDAISTLYDTKIIFPKARWYFTFQQPETPNIFSTHDNALAARLRRAQKPAYDALPSYEYAVDDCASIFASKLASFIPNDATQSDTFDLGWWLTCFAFDVNGEITFSKRFGHLDSGKDIGNIAGALAERLDYCAQVGIYHELHPFFWKIIGLLTYIMKQIDYTFVFTMERMKEHEPRAADEKAKGSSRTKTPDMLTRLMELNQTDPENFSQHDVVIGAYTSIVAGADTTWMSLGSTMFFLHRYPQTLARLREEIDDFAAAGKISDPITWEEAKNMPYVNAVIKEAQRLYAPVALPLWRTVPEGGAMIEGKWFKEGVST